MKLYLLTLKTLLLAALALGSFVTASAEVPSAPPTTTKDGLNLYVIERDMPGLGKLTAADLKAASQKSCGVIKNLGPQIQWQYSFVTGNKMYCVYLAPNEELIREHAKQGGFPANAVNRVATTISPKTAE